MASLGGQGAKGFAKGLTQGYGAVDSALTNKQNRENAQRTANQVAEQKKIQLENMHKINNMDATYINEEAQKKIKTQEAITMKETANKSNAGINAIRGATTEEDNVGATDDANTVIRTNPAVAKTLKSGGQLQQLDMKDPKDFNFAVQQLAERGVSQESTGMSTEEWKVYVAEQNVMSNNVKENGQYINVDKVAQVTNADGSASSGQKKKIKANQDAQETLTKTAINKSMDKRIAKATTDLQSMGLKVQLPPNATAEQKQDFLEQAEKKLSSNYIVGSDQEGATTATNTLNPDEDTVDRWYRLAGITPPAKATKDAKIKQMEWLSKNTDLSTEEITNRVMPLKVDKDKEFIETLDAYELVKDKDSFRAKQLEKRLNFLTTRNKYGSSASRSQLGINKAYEVGELEVGDTFTDLEGKTRKVKQADKDWAETTVYNTENPTSIRTADKEIDYIEEADKLVKEGKFKEAQNLYTKHDKEGVKADRKTVENMESRQLSVNSMTSLLNDLDSDKDIAKYERGVLQNLGANIGKLTEPEYIAAMDKKFGSNWQEKLKASVSVDSRLGYIQSQFIRAMSGTAASDKEREFLVNVMQSGRWDDEVYMKQAIEDFIGMMKEENQTMKGQANRLPQDAEDATNYTERVTKKPKKKVVEGKTLPTKEQWVNKYGSDKGYDAFIASYK